MTDKLKEEVFKATEILKQGGVILYPTDTIWGLGCDATNEKAVKRIYEIKQREDNKSMARFTRRCRKNSFLCRCPGHCATTDRSQ